MDEKYCQSYCILCSLYGNLMTLITSFYLCIGTHPGQLDMSLSSWTKGSCGEMGVVSMLNPAPRYHGAFYKVWRRKGSIIDAPHHHLTYLTWYPRFPSCTEGCSTAQWVWSVNSLSCRQTRSFKNVAWDFYCVWWGCFAIKVPKHIGTNAWWWCFLPNNTKHWHFKEFTINLSLNFYQKLHKTISGQ